MDLTGSMAGSIGPTIGSKKNGFNIWAGPVLLSVHGLIGRTSRSNPFFKTLIKPLIFKFFVY